MAWVIVGWKGPPNGEYALRWVGSVWPNEKKVERALIKWLVCFSDEIGFGSHLLVKQRS